MSAVAMPFDPVLGLGPRPTPLTWPTASLETSASPEGLVSHDYASTYPQGSDASLTPPSVTSSLTSSPPRHGFTHEQRELKRQQDRARRDSRLATRLRRVSETPFMDSPTMSPIHDPATTMEMPSYSAPTAPVSLLSESPGSMSQHTYMPSYGAPLNDASQAQMFPTAYTPSLQQSYGMPMEYQPSPYQQPSSYSSRSSSLSVGQESGMMYHVPAVMTSGGTSSTTTTTTSNEGSHVRVVHSRPKPRCWEHGCNGRQFSTFSNLLRHQREKSGQATKASCPNCGAEFTRTTARNGHMMHDKCKQRRNS